MVCIVAAEVSWPQAMSFADSQRAAHDALRIHHGSSPDSWFLIDSGDRERPISRWGLGWKNNRQEIPTSRKTSEKWTPL